MESNGRVSLNKILSNYNKLLVDTSSLDFNGHLKFVNGETNLNIMRRSNKLKSYHFWYDAIKSDSDSKIYITPGIFSEFSYNGDFDSFKISNLNNSKKDKFKSKSNKQYRVLVKSSINRAKNLIKLIQEKDSILTFNEFQNGVFENLLENFEHLKYQKRTLSDKNYKLFISGATLSLSGDKTAISTNDRGIMNAWIDLLSEEPFFDNDNFTLFRYCGDETFKEVERIKKFF